MINDKQHGALLQDSISEGNLELRDLFSMNMLGWRMFSTFEAH